MMACLAVCAAMRPKSFGVTSTSTSSPTWASSRILRAMSSGMVSKVGLPPSVTIKRAMALILPLSGSISTRSSRAGPTLLREAASNAVEMASTITVRSMPFSFS